MELTDKQIQELKVIEKDYILDQEKNKVWTVVNKSDTNANKWMLKQNIEEKYAFKLKRFCNHHNLNLKEFIEYLQLKHFVFKLKDMVFN